MQQRSSEEWKEILSGFKSRQERRLRIAYQETTILQSKHPLFFLDFACRNGIVYGNTVKNCKQRDSSLFHQYLLVEQKSLITHYPLLFAITKTALKLILQKLLHQNSSLNSQFTFQTLMKELQGFMDFTPTEPEVLKIERKSSKS